MNSKLKARDITIAHIFIGQREYIRFLHIKISKKYDFAGMEIKTIMLCYVIVDRSCKKNDLNYHILWCRNCDIIYPVG